MKSTGSMEATGGLPTQRASNVDLWWFCWFGLNKLLNQWMVSRNTHVTLLHDVYNCIHHDDVIKWKHFPRYWPFVRGIHRSPVNSPHKGRWRGALMFSLICVWINGRVNNLEAGDLRRYRAHYDVIIGMIVRELVSAMCIINSLRPDNAFISLAIIC